LVRHADYIFGMTHSHVETIALMYPQMAEKTFLLREFDETLEPYEKDISDPIGGSYQVYLNARDQIEQGIASLIIFMEKQNVVAHEASILPSMVKFAQSGVGRAGFRHPIHGIC
jgi:hypothetical protein